MRVLVLGHNGMLGTDVMKVFDGHDLHGMSIEDVDITDFSDLKKKTGEINPDIMINCAAYTDVDGCETNTDTAFNVNAEGVKNIAGICSEAGIKLVHLSTDYVFDGNKETPYDEDDKTLPLSVYGASKLKGEEYLKGILDDHLILRVEWLFGRAGKNFVATMIRLSEEKDKLTVVNDQFGSPTYTYDVAKILNVMVDKNLSGTYHVSNRGFTSWYGFAKKIFELIKKPVIVEEISSSEFMRPAKRPSNSVFDLRKLEEATELKMPSWEDALTRYLSELNLI
jgi:dTDP-4-dehydrorhamnose reductase